MQNTPPCKSRTLNGTPRYPVTLPARPLPGLLRRLAAIAYDMLLLTAVLMLAALPVVLINNGPPRTAWALILFRAYLLGVALAFFTWFWMHGGQTLGMRAWRLRVVGADRQPLTWRQASGRFFAAALSWACLGVGFLSILFDEQRLAWHDRLSGTRLILLAKNGDRRSGRPTQQH